MTTTLQVLPDESTRPAEQATPGWLNEGAGAGIRALRARRSQRHPNYQRDFLAAAHLYEKVCSGDSYAALQFKEAMSTSDFPLLFGDVIDRMLLGAYQDWPSTWQSYVRRGTVRDFRTVKRFYVDGGSSTLDPVKQGGEYPETGLTEGKYEYSVTKRGRAIPLTWETLVNDDLDAFRDIPQTLGRAGKMTEDKVATQLYVDPTGPDATFFSAGNTNVITGNPALSVAGLQTAMTVLASHTDTDGNPIFINGVSLVVPPALKVVANNIINATEILAASGGGAGTGNDQIRVANWMRNEVTPVVNPWLPIIDLLTGNTAWYVIANPAAGRPAMELGFLRGNESPQVFVKAPDQLRIGGGMAPVEDGDFATDSVRYKVRHVLGGSLMDPKMAVASTGDGGGGS
jgi:hypothetical protein